MKVTVGSDVTVLTLSRVNITCVVSGIPKPSITWLRDGEQLDTEEGSFLVLSIQDVRDAGKITCQAENMAGKAALSTIMNVIGREKRRIYIMNFECTFARMPHEPNLINVLFCLWEPAGNCL